MIHGSFPCIVPVVYGRVGVYVQSIPVPTLVHDLCGVYYSYLDNVASERCPRAVCLSTYSSIIVEEYLVYVLPWVNCFCGVP